MQTSCNMESTMYDLQNKAKWGYDSTMAAVTTRNLQLHIHNSVPRVTVIAEEHTVL
jgi:hypothetical protein